MAKKAKTTKINPEEALQFLEDMRTLMRDKDELTVPVNVRIPANILRALKAKAKNDGKKYQSLMIDYLRRGLRDR